jgi:catalase
LSILGNPANTFKGRKLGILVTDGVDGTLLKALQDAAEAEGAVVKLIAPQVGGVKPAKGGLIEANEKLDGGPSVVFDAVAILASKEGSTLLADEATARDFIADAFAHVKFIAYAASAKPLLDKAGVAPDDGCVEIASAKDATAFLKRCRDLRFWAREAKVKRI